MGERRPSAPHDPFGRLAAEGAWFGVVGHRTDGVELLAVPGSAGHDLVAAASRRVLVGLADAMGRPVRPVHVPGHHLGVLGHAGVVHPSPSGLALVEWPGRVRVVSLAELAGLPVVPQAA